MEKLYRPKGRNQELYKALERVQQAKADFSRWREQSDQYAHLKEQFVSCTKEIAQREGEVIEQEKNMQQVQLCLQAYPSWIDLQEKRKALLALPSFDGKLPADPLTRLEALLLRHESLQDKQRAIDLKMSELKQHAQVLEPNMSLAERVDQLAELAAELEQWSGQDRRLAELEAECDQLQLDLDRLVRQSDANWTVEELRRFPATVHERNEVQRHGESLRAAKQHSIDLERELQSVLRAEQTQRERTDQLVRQQQDIWQHHLSMFTIDHQPVALQTVRQLPQVASAATQLRERTARVIRLIERKNDVHSLAPEGEESFVASTQRRARGSKHRLSKKRWQFRFNLELVLVVLCMLVMSYSVWQSLWVMVAVTIPLLLSLIVLMLRKRHQQVTPKLTDVLHKLHLELESEKEQLARELDSFHRQLHEAGLSEVAVTMEQQYAHVDEHQTLQLQKLMPLHDLLQTLATELIDASRQLEMIQQETERAEQLRTETRKRADLLQQQLQEADAKLDAIQAQWVRWLNKVHLPESIDPDTALHVFEKVEHGLQVLAQLERLQQTCTSIRKRQQQFLMKVAEVISTSSEDSERLISSFQQHWHEAKQEAEKLKQWQPLQQQIRELQQEKQVLTVQLQELSHELHAMYQAAGVTGEEAFRRVVEIDRKGKQLQQEIRQLETVIEGLTGSKQLKLVQEILATKGKLELEQEAMALRQQLNVKQEQLKILREKKGSLQREMDRLEHAEEPSAYAQKVASCKDELQQMAEKCQSVH